MAQYVSTAQVGTTWFRMPVRSVKVPFLAAFSALLPRTARSVRVATMSMDLPALLALKLAAISAILRSQPTASPALTATTNPAPPASPAHNWAAWTAILQLALSASQATISPQAVARCVLPAQPVAANAQRLQFVANASHFSIFLEPRASAAVLRWSDALFARVLAVAMPVTEGTILVEVSVVLAQTLLGVWFVIRVLAVWPALRDTIYPQTVA